MKGQAKHYSGQARVTLGHYWSIWKLYKGLRLQCHTNPKVLRINRTTQDVFRVSRHTIGVA